MKEDMKHEPISRDEVRSGELGRKRQGRLLLKNILASLNPAQPTSCNPTDELDLELRDLVLRAGNQTSNYSAEALLEQSTRWQHLIPQDPAMRRILFEAIKQKLNGEPKSWAKLEKMLSLHPATKPALKRERRCITSPKAWPIGVKLGILIVTFSFIPSVLVGNVGALLAEQQAQKTDQKELQGMAKAVAGQLNQEIEDYKQLAHFLSNDPLLTAYAASHANQRHRWQHNVLSLLDRINTSHQNAAIVYVLDQNGRCIASSDRKLIGQDYSFRTYFQEGLRQPVFVSGTYLPFSTSRPDPLISISSPLAHRDQIVGVVVIATYTLAQSKALALPSGMSAMVIESDGLIASASDSKLRLSVIGPNDSSTNTRLQRISQNPNIDAGKRFRRMLSYVPISVTLQPIIQASQPGVAIGTMNHRDVGAAWHPLEIKGWTTVVMSERAPLMRSSEAIHRQVMLLSTVLGLIAMLGAVAASRNISNPLRALTLAATQLEKDQPIDEASLKRIGKRSDDLGILGKRILEAARESSKRMANLRAQVATLRIEIDRSRRDRDVDAIVDNQFFSDLKSAASELRRQRKERRSSNS